MFVSAASAKVRTPFGIVMVPLISFIILGIYPPFSSNGANPVVAEMLAFIANLVRGTLSAQFRWS